MKALLPIFGLLVFATTAFTADDALVKLDEFQTKVTKAEAAKLEAMKAEMAKAAEAAKKANPSSSTDMVVARNMERLTMESQSRVSMQLTKLKAMITRGDLDQASQMIQNLGEYGLPPDLQTEWAELAPLLTADLEARKMASMEKWRGDVDQLVVDAKQACLAAKNSSDLDPVLIRCAALQMQRQQQNNVLGERIYRKLSGTAEMLEAWANFLDFKAAGNAKAGNQILQRLESNESQFPLLTNAEIEAQMMPPSPGQATMQEMWPKIFENVNGPDDLTLVIERIRNITAKNTNPELVGMNGQLQGLTSLQRAWVSAKAGDDAMAMQALASSGGGSEEVKVWTDPMRNEITMMLLEKKTGAWSKAAREPNEDSTDYLSRIQTELKAAGKYAELLEVIKFADQLNRSAVRPGSQGSRQAIEQYLAAQRYEAASDDLPALINYRLVLATPTGPLVPTSEAQEALKRLQAKNPDLFKNYEGVLLQEITSLKQQIQVLMSRQPTGVRPYPPYQ